MFSADLDGADEGLPEDPVGEAAGKFVIVELEFEVETKLEDPDPDVETEVDNKVEPNALEVDVESGLEMEIEAEVEVDAGLAITFDGVGVEIDCFTAPIVAAIFTPSPSAQQVVFEPPQHQLPSVHCIRATLFVGSPPLCMDMSQNLCCIEFV